jgi:hypothetical protein
LTRACGGCHRCIDGYFIYIHTEGDRGRERERKTERTRQRERVGIINKQTKNEVV